MWEAIGGTTAQYLTVMFEPTGKAGKAVAIGEINTIEARTGSYRQGVETRRDFRGFGQETRGQQAPVAARQAPAQTKGQQAPVATRQAPDLSKNKSAFGGVGRGSDAQKQRQPWFQEPPEHVFKRSRRCGPRQSWS